RPPVLLLVLIALSYRQYIVYTYMCQAFSIFYAIIRYMNVYFSTSTRTLSENIEECRAILDTIKQNGHHVTMDWIDEAYERISRHDKLSTEKYPELYGENLHALNVSDVVIIEASANTFNSGY